jgi:hypothetical protein
MNKKTLVFAFLLAAIVGCQTTPYEREETPLIPDLPQYTIEDVEKIAHIEIPASASEIQVYANTGWMDDAALIKFKLPLEELDSFLEMHRFNDLKKGFWSIQNAPPSVVWWPRLEPNSIPPIEVYLGEKLNSPGFSQSILIDATNVDFYIVYLQFFET